VMDDMGKIEALLAHAECTCTISRSDASCRYSWKCWLQNRDTHIHRDYGDPMTNERIAEISAQLCGCGDADCEMCELCRLAREGLGMIHLDSNPLPPCVRCRSIRDVAAIQTYKSGQPVTYTVLCEECLSGLLELEDEYLAGVALAATPESDSLCRKLEAANERLRKLCVEIRNFLLTNGCTVNDRRLLKKILEALK
jgi:hypothetical protein